MALSNKALIVHRDGRVLSGNARMLHDEQTLPCTLGEIFVGTTDDLIRDIIRSIGDGWSTLRPRLGDGPIAFKITPLRSSGRKPMQFLLYETDRRAKNYSFATLTKRLAQSEVARGRVQNKLLQADYTQMERFSYMAAHDLKAPLRNISSLLDFLEEDFGAELPGGAQVLLSSARTSSDRLQRLISDLLLHARTGSASLKKALLDIDQVLEDVKSLLESDFAESGATLLVKDDIGTIDADPSLFRQLIQNLVANAIKYRSPERTPSITVRRGRNGTSRDIVVQDNGQGFSQDYAEQIFEPFNRLHSAAEIEGSGIGLATCRSIAERHGWGIRAEGKPDEGAIFIISPGD